MGLVMLILLIACGLYIALYIAVRKYKFLNGHVDIYGPLIALKTENVTFFDRFKRYKTFFEAYGYVGAFITVVVGTLILASLIFFLIVTLKSKPSPVGVYAPQNIFLIPGLNEFIPATVAVFIGIVIAVIVHEFGHAILCRVRDVRLKSTGILLAVIPIGAFVDPNNEEMESASIKSRILIYGAGITNNLVVGIASIVLMMILISLFIGLQSSDRVIAYEIDIKAPGYQAGISPGDWIKSIDGVNITTNQQYFNYITSKHPGDKIVLMLETSGVEKTVEAVLIERPENMSKSGNELSRPGYLGVSGVNFGETLNGMVKESFSPVGVLRLMSIPVVNDNNANIMRIIVMDTTYKQLYGETFYGFWMIIHILFWIGWMNINIGLFNALPMIPLDGGYILKDGLKKILGNTKYIGVVSRATTYVSIAIVSMIILIYLLPHIFAYI